MAIIKDRQVRVFISSTFRDMNDERDYLVRYVFPRIKEYCRKRYIDFVPIDLRWGITEETSRNSLVLNTCFEEIDNSRPYFIGILGGRYGWVPTQEEMSHVNPRTSSDAQWLNRISAQGASVTEMEIEYGALRTNGLPHAIFFIKDDNATPAQYREATGSKAEARLRGLKQKLRNQDRYPVVNYSRVEEIGRRVEQELIKMIDEEFPDSSLDYQQSLIYPHEQALSKLADRAIGISVDFFKQWVEGGNKTLVVQGAPGTGVSTCIAKGVEYLRKCYTSKILYFDFASVNTGEDPIDALVDFIELPINEIADDQWGLYVFDNTSMLNLQQSQQLVAWIDDTADNLHFILGLTADTPTWTEARYKLKRGEITVGGFDGQRIRTYAETTLAKYGKHLTKAQLDAIESTNAFAHPAELRLFLQALIDYGSYEGLDERIHGLIKESKFSLFWFLVKEGLGLYSKIDMSRQFFLALYALAANQQGISEDELLMITGLEQSQWSVVRPYILQFCKGGPIRLRLIKDSWSSDLRDMFDPKLIARTGLEMLERILKHSIGAEYAVIMRHIFSYACPYLAHLDAASNERGLSIGVSLATSPDCVLALPDYEYSYLMSKELLGTRAIGLLLNPVLKGIHDGIGHTIGRKLSELGRDEREAYYHKVANNAKALCYGNMVADAYRGIANLYPTGSIEAVLNNAKTLIALGRVSEARKQLKQAIGNADKATTVYMDMYIQTATTYVLEHDLETALQYIYENLPTELSEEGIAAYYPQVMELIMRIAYLRTLGQDRYLGQAVEILNRHRGELGHLCFATPATYYSNMAQCMLRLRANDLKGMVQPVVNAVEAAFYCWGAASWQYGRAMLLRAYLYWHLEGDYRDRRPYKGYYPPRPYDEVYEANPLAPKIDWTTVDKAVRSRIAFEHEIMRQIVIGCQNAESAKKFETDTFAQALGIK